MKLFQQLLVAPAALGLMAPMAANAAELNINQVSDYASGSEVQNFSDVYPTDWTFQALTSLAERHGCAVANPSGSITRYEAATLLNKCLGDVAQVNEEERRLINEFAPELAVIKGRVDGLESRVGEFEAGQFSNTTKLSGKAIFIIGKADHDGDQTPNNTDSTTFEYSYQMDMNSSFSGDDRLYVRIKSGNVSDHWKDSTQGMYLSAANAGDKYDGTNYSVDSLYVDKLWYQFPIGEQFTAWIGPKIENYYMLASAPSIYKPVMKQFALGGNGPVYGSSTQPGFGVAWTQPTQDPSEARFAVSGAYTAQNGETSTASQGMFGDDSKSALLTKVEYGSPRWQVSVAAAFKKDGWTDSYFSTAKGKLRDTASSETAIGLRAYWKPEEEGAIPSISVGYDTTSITDVSTSGYPEEASGWMMGFGWKDVVVDGNTAGLAFGSRVHATQLKGGSPDGAEDTFSWEAYYTFQVSDNVSVTPALFGNKEPSTNGVDNSGALVLTQFKF
jgi:hypothetical protein